MKRKTSPIDFLRIFILMSLLAGLQACTSPESREKARDTTWAMMPFLKLDEINPILVPGDNTFNCPVRKERVKWEIKDVFNPAVVVRNDLVFMIFRAEDSVGRYNGTSRLGLAVSSDGKIFNKVVAPVLYPNEDFMKPYEWEGGIEDPRIVESEYGTYILTYSAYDGKTARLCIATSPDLLNWTKQGLAFGPEHADLWSKSGAIVARQQGDKMVAEKINGKYWMYFGDTNLFLATSTDLIHWLPVEEEGALLPVLEPRPGYFDSRLVESGPFALMKEQGIVLIYNSMNLDEGGDPNLPGGTYSAGQALFDKSNPAQLIGRLEHNFLRPDRDYEIKGQVNQVCFLEGLIHLKDRWILYYGTADSKIAAAEWITEPQ